jgi:hypothetical protein
MDTFIKQSDRDRALELVRASDLEEQLSWDRTTIQLENCLARSLKITEKLVGIINRRVTR